jgi:hypothetical protein
VSTLRYSTSGAKLALAALVAGSFALLIPVAASAAPAKAAQVEARGATAKKAEPRKADVKAAPRSAAKGKAQAGPGSNEAPEVSGLPGEPQYTSALAPAEEADNCVRQRRRLFVEGEGWIVRRVAICP